MQSPSFKHCAVCTQPFAVSHAKPVLHELESAVFAHVPEAQESLVQSTLSSQAAALQQLPHVADAPSVDGQHVGPAADPSHSAFRTH